MRASFEPEATVNSCWLVLAETGSGRYRSGHEKRSTK